MSPVSVFAGVDVGGTKILCGAVGPDGEVLARSRVPTPRGSTAEELCDAIVGAVKQVGDGIDLAGVGVGRCGVRKRGPVDGDVRAAPAVPALPARGAAGGHARPAGRHRERRQRRHLGRGPVRSGARTPTTSSASRSAPAWAARVIVGDHLQRGANGFGGEFGHLRVVPDGHPCPCGQKGCLEQYASGSALTRFAKELVVARGADAGMLYALAEGDAERVTGPMVTEAARAGDEQAKGVFTQLATWLGAGLSTLSSVLDPEVIVVGGGLVEASDLFLDTTREVYAATLTGADFRRLAEILPAELGQDAGFLGAADLAATGG